MKIVLFDIDETLLVYLGDGDKDSSSKMFKQVFNIDADENMVDNRGKTERGIIEEVLRLVKKLTPEEEIEIPNLAYEVWAEAQKSFPPPFVFPGIIELLDVLSKEKDVLIGLLTGNSRFRAKVKLEAAKLDKYFLKDGILTGAFGDISPIRADLITEAKQKYGDGTYTIIDDSLIAAKMCKEANIPALLVATGRVSEEELRQYSKYVFPDFGENRWQEVLEIIKGL